MLVDRIKGLIKQPKAEWEAIAAEPADNMALYKSYAMPLAAIGPLASVVGLSMVGVEVPGVGTVRLGFFSALGGGLLGYVLGLVGVYVVALIIDALAPTFEARKDPGQALKVSIYAATPGWLAGIFQIIPSALGLLSLLVTIYGVYLLYLGLQAGMKAPKEKALAYTALVILAAVLIMLAIGALTGLLLR